MDEAAVDKFLADFVDDYTDEELEEAKRLIMVPPSCELDMIDNYLTNEIWCEYYGY